MIPESFVILAPILSFVGGFFYIRDTLRGTTKPNRVSFFLWAFAPILGSAISYSEGAGVSALPVFMAGFVPLLIFIASFFNKNAYWKLSIFDYVCGLFSVLALVLWLSIHSATIAITFAVLADLFAYIPTWVKAWKNPETETAALYVLSTVGNLIGLLVIREWAYTAYIFSSYLIIGNLICIAFIYRKKIFKGIASGRSSSFVA